MTTKLETGKKYTHPSDLHRIVYTVLFATDKSAVVQWYNSYTCDQCELFVPKQFWENYQEYREPVSHTQYVFLLPSWASNWVDYHTALEYYKKEKIKILAIKKITITEGEFVNVNEI